MQQGFIKNNKLHGKWSISFSNMSFSEIMEKCK